MSVARARELVARARAAGIVVHEMDGCYSRGNGQTSAYEGWVNHHTATAFGMAPPVLWTGRPDLAPPLCNTAGNFDGSATLVSAHPANHAGSSGGWDTAPLPRTGLFNRLVWGHEIVYPGSQPMTAAQYRTAVILSRIGVDIWGYGDVRRIKFHQGTSITGKWDPGYAPGKTVDIAAFRTAALNPQEDRMLADERNAVISTWAAIFTKGGSQGDQSIIDRLLEIQRNTRLVPQVVAAVTKNPDITPEQVGALLDKAVATHSPTAQQIAEAQRPFLVDVVGQALGADNAEQADAIVNELVSRLAEGK